MKMMKLIDIVEEKQERQRLEQVLRNRERFLLSTRRSSVDCVSIDDFELKWRPYIDVFERDNVS